mgnify:CR=1 FL=1
MLPSEGPVRPFTIFISSSQKEFEKFRKNLKEAIDSERFIDQRIMRAVLIEEERGPAIPEDISREIEGCSIYVGIFGREKSEWTFAEYREARAKDLPLLIYQLKRQRRPGKPKEQERRGRKSEVELFLDKEVKSLGIRVRGPYRTEVDLERSILNDLAGQVAEMVKESATIRKAIHKGLRLP